jgi:hypothetical protein
VRRNRPRGNHRGSSNGRSQPPSALASRCGAFPVEACARVGRSGVASRPASFMRNVAQQSYSARAFCSRGVARFGSNGTLEKRSRERPSRTPIELGRSRQRPARYPPVRPHGRPPPRGGPCRRCGLLSPVHMIKLTKRARLCIRMRNGRAEKETCATRANRPRGHQGYQWEPPEQLDKPQFRTSVLVTHPRWIVLRDPQLPETHVQPETRTLHPFRLAGHFLPRFPGRDF